MMDAKDTQKTDYEAIKERLSVLVRNAESWKETLGSCPHEIHEDLAMLYCIDLDSKEGMRKSVIINYNLLGTLDVSEEQIRRDAWENMKHSNPPCFLAMEDILKEIMNPDAAKHTDIRGQLNETAEDDVLYVLTNLERINGAAYICDEETMSAIAKKMDSDLIVIPSSIHEILILRDKEEIDLDEIRKMVEEINENVVVPQERLSDSVYRFGKESHLLEQVEPGTEQGMGIRLY